MTDLDRDTGELLEGAPVPSWALSPTISKLAASLAQAQGAMRSAEFDRQNPHFGSRYMSLASLWATIRGPLSSNGLSVLQLVHADGLLVSVESILLHESGECVRTVLTLTARDPSAQALGSLITYLRRYSLSSLIGVVGDDDDDANGADKLPSLKGATKTGKPDKPQPEPSKRRPLEGGYVEPPAAAPPAAPPDTITDRQRTRLFAVATAAGWQRDELKTFLLARYGVATTKAIPQSRYDGILEVLEHGPEPEPAPETTEPF